MVPEANRITSADDADALALGLGLLSTGGGGWPRRGAEYLRALLADGFEVGWVTVDSLPPDAMTCSVFGMGSTAPHPRMTDEEAARSGFFGERFARPGIRALRELGEHLGAPLDAVVPVEIGGFNTTVAIDAAVRSGVLVVDGDFCGRSLPEMSQSLPAARGVPAWPLTICDQWGNLLIMKDCPSGAVAERIGKMVSIVSKAPDVLGTCAHAAFSMSAEQTADVIVRGSLTLALEIGRQAMDARASGEDVVSVVAKAMGGLVLFEGVASAKEWDSRDGYHIGTTDFTGTEGFQGSTARVWFRNENHLLWRDGDIIAMSPDLIAVVDARDASPRTNTELKVGERVAIVARAADPAYREGVPLELTEPRHYGFDLDYIPLENLNPRPA
jgi:DUF917 family protein